MGMNEKTKKSGKLVKHYQVSLNLMFPPVLDGMFRTGESFIIKQ